MKLAVLGHSLIHIRQQNFFKLLSKQENIEVGLFTPGEWGSLRTSAYTSDNFSIYTLNCYSNTSHNDLTFDVNSLRTLLNSYSPDWIYVQQEPGSALVKQVIDITEETKVKRALFTWENIALTETAQSAASEFDVVVCGNDEAQRLIRNPNTIILPQVGVDTDHFQSRPTIRSIGCAYIGRNAEEKGINQLKIAWPLVKLLPWQDYLYLPWYYSQVAVLVCFSQDTRYWKEQAMPYVSVEGLCCGAYPIVSDGGSIRFWHERFNAKNPSVTIVPQGDVTGLKDAIEYSLNSNREQQLKEGREWVEAYLSNRAIAKRLAECLSR